MKEKGITLIALIVTIIIMLILAGVVINMAIGNSNLFQTAQKASQQYKIQQIKEKIEIEIADIYTDCKLKQQEITVDDTLEELLNRGKFEEIDLEENYGSTEGYIVYLKKDPTGYIVIDGIEEGSGFKFSYELTPSQYTNQTVNVRLLMGGSIPVVNISVPDNMTYIEERVYQVTQNGTYSIVVELENGERKTKEVIINNIDKLPPNDFTITSKPIVAGFEIIGQTSDAEASNENACSGIERYEYYVNNTKYTTSQIQGLNKGTYSVYAICYDKAGNSKKSNTISVTLTTKIVQISAGCTSSLALDEMGILWVWGSLPGGLTGTKPTKKVVSMKIADISQDGSTGHVLAIDEVGNLWAWGNNNYGQVGNNSKTYVSAPVKIKAGTKFKKIATGENHSLAIDEAGNLWTWGRNDYGQLGNNSKTNSLVPVQIKAGTKFKEIFGAANSDGFSFAIDEAGNLWAWGQNSNGQLGNGTTTESLIPIQIKKGTKFKKVVASDYHTLAIDEAGNLWAWGFNVLGQFGNGTTSNSTVPVQTKKGTKFKEIATSGHNSFAIDEAGNLWCAGSNQDGQLGNGTTNQTNTMIRFKAGTKFTQISGGIGHILALDESGNLWSCGKNSNSQIGNGSNKDILTPYKVIF